MNSKNNFPHISLAVPALILASIIWGGTGAIMKLTLESVPLFSLALIRFGVAAVILLPFVVNSLKIQKKDVPKLFICAFLGIPLHIGFFFFGIRLTTALNSGMIIASIPLFTLFLAHIFLKEKISKNMLLGGAFGVLGIGVIIGKDLLTHGFSLSPLGDFLIILSALTFVFYELFSKKLFVTYSPLVITFYSFLIGSIFFLPFAIQEFQSDPLWIHSIPNMAYAGIWYGIFFSSLAAYTLWQWGLSKISASKVGFFLYLDPIASTIMAIVLLSEKITTAFIIGSILIFIGLFLAEIHIRYHHAYKTLKEK